MGKDRARQKHKQRKGVLGTQTDEVLAPRDNGNVKFIENMAKSLDKVGPSPHSATQANHGLLQRNKAMANDGTQAESKQRDRNIRYSYRDKDNQITDKFTSDCRSVIFTLDKTNKQAEFALHELVKDAELLQRICDESPMLVCSALFGMKTTTGNAVTAVKSGDADEMLEAIEERKETIVGGEWREGGTRGPNPKDVLQAMIAARTQKKGETPDEAWQAKAWAAIKLHGAKQILLDKEILAEFEAEKSRKQEAKVAKLRAEAAATQGGASTNEALAGLMD